MKGDSFGSLSLSKRRKNHCESFREYRIYQESSKDCSDMKLRSSGLLGSLETYQGTPGDYETRFGESRDHEKTSTKLPRIIQTGWIRLVMSETGLRSLKSNTLRIRISE